VTNQMHSFPLGRQPRDRLFGQFDSGGGSHDARIRVQLPAGSVAPLFQVDNQIPRKGRGGGRPVRSRQTTYLKIARIEPIKAAEFLAQRNSQSVAPHDGRV
jgi:hypothetical protein